MSETPKHKLNPDPRLLDVITQRLRSVFVCPYCGQPKAHHRLYGYRCSNPDCNDKAARGDKPDKDTTP